LIKRLFAVVSFVGLAGAAYVAGPFWRDVITRPLVCENSDARSDALLIDHVGGSYPLFERARILQAREPMPPVLVPVLVQQPPFEPAWLSFRITKLMCDAAALSECITFAVPLAEPISLNVAQHTAHELQARGIRSVSLVTDGFRSKRAAMVYARFLEPLGIVVHCQPVFGALSQSSWHQSFHGTQNVVLQLLKLAYYRVVVLPSHDAHRESFANAPERRAPIFGDSRDPD